MTGPTIHQLNALRALARRLNVPVGTPKTAEQAERQIAALRAFEADG